MAKKVETNKKAQPKKQPKAPCKSTNVIVSYNKIDNELKLELAKKYPEGYADFIHRYPKPNGESFFAVPLETKDKNYLIKVEVKIDNIITEDDFDKHFGDLDDDNKSIGEVEVEDNDDDVDDDDDVDEGDNEDDDDE